jgi:hypothetical protein
VRRALLAAALLLAGCPRPPAQRPGPPPTAEQLVAHLRARAARLQPMRTDAKVDYLAEKGDRIKLAMTFLTRPPDGLRIDAENPMGGTVASLASDGDTFQLIDSRANRFLTGAATPCNIARLLRVRLRPADVIAVIMGGAPLLGEPSSVAWDGSDGGHEVLTLKGEGGLVETIKLTPTVWDVASAEVTGADGAIVYRLAHEEFAEQGGLRLPGKSWIFDPAHKADAKIRYRSREAAPPLPPNAFHLDAPPGLPVDNVQCAD